MNLWLLAMLVGAGAGEPAIWLTAPARFADYDEAALWSTRTRPLAELAGGVTQVDAPGRPGRAVARWADHPRYPTIHCDTVTADWSMQPAVAIDLWSGGATGERVTWSFLADNPTTPARDWWWSTFVVDWTGWRTLRLARESFQPLGQPAGWETIGGVYFFTKIFDAQPLPETVLLLDELRPDPGPVPLTAPVPVAGAASVPETGRLATTQQLAPLPLARFNHPGPELAGPGPVTAPITYGAYFQAERALFGYDPKFVPGTVSFGPDGRAWLLAGAGLLQWRGADGQWQQRDLVAEVIEPYAREVLHFRQLKLGDSGQTNESVIRFDRDGDAYLMAFIEDPTGDWKTRTGLLLHSRDGLRTWTVYRLPWYMARFEKWVGHNPDALSRPPVILLSRYFSPTELYLLLPEKRPDGSLVLPPPIPVADDAISWLPHSGEANQALSHGDQVFLVYGQLRILPGHTKEDGAPAYAVVYDRRTGRLSDPVLLGFGGIDALDGHNWPALAVDSQGRLHVLINGHHDPLTYTASERPWDISGWTAPVRFGAGSSYAGLVCDAQDTLYSVSRYSDPGYYFRLSLLRKRQGQAWSPARTLIMPFKPYYKVWFHKLGLAPDGRLFLSYHAQSPSICVFRDEYDAYVDIWPDREQRFQSGETPKLPLGTYCEEPRRYEFYSPPASETAILMSDDQGETWRLATSPDFGGGQG